MKTIKRVLSGFAAAAVASVVGTIALTGEASANTIRFREQHGHTQRHTTSTYNVHGQSSAQRWFNNNGFIYERGHLDGGLDVKKSYHFNEGGYDWDFESRNGVVQSVEHDSSKYRETQLNNWGL